MYASGSMRQLLVSSKVFETRVDVPKEVLDLLKSLEDYASFYIEKMITFSL